MSNAFDCFKNILAMRKIDVTFKQHQILCDSYRSCWSVLSDIGFDSMNLTPNLFLFRKILSEDDFSPCLLLQTNKDSCSVTDLLGYVDTAKLALENLSYHPEVTLSWVTGFKAVIRFEQTRFTGKPLEVTANQLIPLIYEGVSVAGKYNYEFETDLLRINPFTEFGKGRQLQVIQITVK